LKRDKWVFCLGKLWAAVLLSLPIGAISQTSGEPIRLLNAWAQFKPNGGLVRNDQIRLPHRWDVQYKTTDGTATYWIDLPRLDVKDSPGAAQILGLYIPRLGNQARIYVNDISIAVLGDFNKPHSDWSKVPVWVTFPATLLNPQRDQKNVLRIDVSVQTGRWGGLSTIEYGFAERIKPIYEQQYMLRHTVNFVIACAYVLMGLIVLGLWIKQRQRLHLLFVLATVFGALRMASILWVNPALNWQVWLITSACVIGFLTLTVNAFCLELIGKLSRRMLIALWIMASITAVCAGAAQMYKLPWLWTACLALFAVPSFWTLFQMAQTYRQKQTLKALFLLLSIVFVIATGLRDFFVLRASDTALDNHAYLPASMFVFVVLMASLIIEQYNDSYLQAKRLAEHLNEEVSKKEHQIKLAYETMSAQMQQQAVLLERQRMMNDIHDGVGAQLVGLVNQAQQAEPNQTLLREQASAALDELRMAVDALQPSEGDLRLILATIRYRLEPRLGACGIALKWDVHALPIQAHLSSHRVLQIQRIIYQAVTNVIEHAHASEIRICASHRDPFITIDIQDNGQGFSHAPSERRGLGLDSMRQRAENIAAALTITSGGSGTCISLQLSME
jgi:signal transduction histidine kinase